MARRISSPHFILLSSMAAFLIHGSGNVQGASQSRSFAGVFMLIRDGKYTFNFTAARDACLELNVTMATTAQMERAHRRGLETCKFGWTAQKIAVIPRHTSDQKCGRGKTGVVSWSASPDAQFAVFCFNTSDTLDTSTIFTSFPSSPNIPTNPTAEASPPPSSMNSPTSRSSSSSSSSAAVTSQSDVARLDVSTSVYSSVSTEGVSPKSVGQSFGVVRTALVAVGVAALLLIVAIVMWQHKLTFLWCCSKELLKDELETEMWKDTFSEWDTRGRTGTAGGQEEEQEEEEEEEVEQGGTELDNTLPSGKTEVALEPLRGSQ